MVRPRDILLQEKARYETELENLKQPIDMTGHTPGTAEYNKVYKMHTGNAQNRAEQIRAELQRINRDLTAYQWAEERGTDVFTQRKILKTKEAEADKLRIEQEKKVIDSAREKVRRGNITTDEERRLLNKERYRRVQPTTAQKALGITRTSQAVTSRAARAATLYQGLRESARQQASQTDLLRSTVSLGSAFEGLKTKGYYAKPRPMMISVQKPTPRLPSTTTTSGSSQLKQEAGGGTIGGVISEYFEKKSTFKGLIEASKSDTRARFKDWRTYAGIIPVTGSIAALTIKDKNLLGYVEGWRRGAQLDLYEYQEKYAKRRGIFTKKLAASTLGVTTNPAERLMFAGAVATGAFGGAASGATAGAAGTTAETVGLSAYASGELVIGGSISARGIREEGVAGFLGSSIPYAAGGIASYGLSKTFVTKPISIGVDSLGGAKPEPPVIGGLPSPYFATRTVKIIHGETARTFWRPKYPAIRHTTHTGSYRAVLGPEELATFGEIGKVGDYALVKGKTTTTTGLVDRSGLELPGVAVTKPTKPFLMTFSQVKTLINRGRVQWLEATPGTIPVNKYGLPRNLPGVMAAKTTVADLYRVPSGLVSDVGRAVVNRQQAKTYGKIRSNISLFKDILDVRIKDLRAGKEPSIGMYQHLRESVLRKKRGYGTGEASRFKITDDLKVILEEPATKTRTRTRASTKNVNNKDFKILVTELEAVSPTKTKTRTQLRTSQKIRFKSLGGIKPLSLSKTETITRVTPVPQTRTAAETRLIMKPISQTTPETRTVTRTTPDTITRTTPETRTTTRTPSITDVRLPRPTVENPRVRIPDLKIPIGKIPVPGFPGFPGGGGGGGRGYNKKFRQAKKYTPSTYAIGLGIKGKKPTLRALKTGFSVRPITGKVYG